jgi:hypothetical protein
MSDVLIVSCRLCLEPDELPSMVTVDRLLKNPPRIVSATICLVCARLIVQRLELLDTGRIQEENFDDAASSPTDRRGGGDPDPAPTADPLVLRVNEHQKDAGVDRPEPEVPAGGADGEPAPEKG